MRVKHVAFSADGSTLVAAGYSMVNIGPGPNVVVRRPPMAGDTKSVEFVASPQEILAMAVSPDGKALFVSFTDPRPPMRGGRQGGRAAAGGQQVKPQPRPGLIARWHIAAPHSNRWRIAGTIVVPAEARGLALSADGQLLVAGCQDGTAVVCEATRGGKIATLTHDSPVDAVAFSVDGKLVATGGSSSVLLWDLDALGSQ
jgi:DNA-binding beta-propeller fold protein YncE